MEGYNNQLSQNAFKNDGSFLEVFKRFQEQQQEQQHQLPSEVKVIETPSPAVAASYTSEKQTDTTKAMPIIGKRKNKILKTGIVKKVKPEEEKKVSKPTDAWSVYLDEVKRYQETVGEQDSKTRPLVK
ncbi:telomerase RNA component interacting RNase-like isoform X1 [Daktulosphaira vitifoliae]|uniref:telomerase RNA component interacting RNase-like isoform X1 n=1 Tax=Daktulosphaira vitifoliae TaxID=58002 RepID=UPI0021AB0069|nr:telomerase RNA component interacting RNase-like isoform X1 [Daktulosphaira vitifoliae]